MAKGKQHRKGLLWLVFILYTAAMLWLLFGRSHGWEAGKSYLQLLENSYNLTPFYTIKRYVNIILHYPNSDYFTHCLINICGNILLFIPAGWLLPRLLPKQRNFFVFFITCFFTILLVETIQLFALLGIFDVDDLILNLSGMVLGYLLHLCTPGARRKSG